ncbi:homocysteine S-methyltransferase family protein [Testudinibacter sp. P27/CKL/0425]
MNFTLLDGGMGRELLRIGAPFKQPEWSALALIEAPHWVTQAHRNFLDAGADIITTNSYACVPFHIGQARFEQQGAALIALAARLAREAADLWLGETMSSFAEAELLLTLLVEQPKPIWISFTLNDETALQAPQLRSGENLAEVLEKLDLSRVEAILFNCSIPEVMQSAVVAAKQWLVRQQSAIQVGVYANGFSPKANDRAANEGLSELRDLSAEEYRSFAEQWLQAGASIIGGCCCITPQHIARLAQLR